MDLELSNDELINTLLRTFDGQVMYKIETPGTLAWYHLPGKCTTFSRVVPNEGEDNDMEDVFSEIAKINWHIIGSSTLERDGTTVDMQDFIPGVGSLGLVGRLVWQFDASKGYESKRSL